MKKYLLLLGLCLMACKDPPKDWDLDAATQWAHAARINPTSIVCADRGDQSTCAVITGTQVINVWCYYRATPYCIPDTK